MCNYSPVLTIAGSDSGGCAGIQADIKSISACGGFAASVITATTAQNTQGVLDIHAIPLAHLSLQLDAVLQDIDFKAIKIGMLHSAEVIELVQDKLAQYQAKNIVLDPVMVATSGDKLIDQNAVNRLRQFIPHTLLITPNLPEAEVLLGRAITSASQQEAAVELAKAFNTSVLLKGGHATASLNAEITDVLYSITTNQIHSFTKPIIDTNNTHGTGCSLSAAIAAFLARGLPLSEAVQQGCHYVHQAIESGSNKRLGKGNGPIDHFFFLPK